MAVFSKLVITRKGQALLAKILSGVKNVNFTSVSASNAEYTVEQLENLIALSDIKQTSLISEKVRASDITVKIDAAFNNFELASGYYMRTIGLYADDPDEGEILYGAAIETSGNCYIPPYNGITVSGTYIQLVITVGNAENVSLEVNPGAIATIKQVNNLAEIINAHVPASVCTLKGVHDLRYYENKLQVYDSESETWGDAGGASEHTDNAALHITDAACTYASSVYTLTPNKAVGNASYFCLRFKAPNDYVAPASFKIGTKTYTAANAAFKQNTIVILNFDVSQSRCFFVSGETYSNATTIQAGLMSTTDKRKLDRTCGQEMNGEGWSVDGEYKTGGQGAEIFNAYDNNHAVASYCTAMGYSTIASGDYSVAMGQETVTKGECSFVTGSYSRANGSCSAAIGNSATANGESSIAMGYGTTANEINMAIGKLNKIPTATSIGGNTGDLFIIGNGAGSKSNAFRVAANGSVYGTKAYTASGADYAEMFEWDDGNPDNEDRRGLFVTLDSEKIRLAKSDDDYILGVVSATPSIVADAQTDDWGKKWKTDIFGERLLDENGAWILNEDFREEDNESYVSRLDRKEWAAVGLVGKLIVVDDSTCEVNGYCVPANGGIATKSETGYRVLSRLDENHIKVLIK